MVDNFDLNEFFKLSWWVVVMLASLLYKRHL
jgi:hypothetical protein